MRRRHEALEAVADVDHVLVYGANRSGTAVGWLTRWPVTREAVVVVTPGERDVLYVGFYNHVPNAQRIATEADVRWIGDFERPSGRIGVIGRPARDGEVDLNARVHAAAAGEVGRGDRVDPPRRGADRRRRGGAARGGAAGRERVRARRRRSRRRGCRTARRPTSTTWPPRRWPRPSCACPRSGRATAAFRPATRSCSRSARTSGSTPRSGSGPSSSTPSRHRSTASCSTPRRRRSTRWWRGCGPARPPPSCGRRRATITIRDDLVHGFVGGYLPPVLGARQPVPDFTFEAGMTVVVQPNVVTPDERAGVQVGELLLVTETAWSGCTHEGVRHRRLARHRPRRRRRADRPRRRRRGRLAPRRRRRRGSRRPRRPGGRVARRARHLRGVRGRADPQADPRADADDFDRTMRVNARPFVLGASPRRAT